MTAPIKQAIAKLHKFDTQHYHADRRTTIARIYDMLYTTLVTKNHWHVDTVFEQPLTLADGKVINFPALAFRNFTDDQAPEKVLIVGIHGTEPASVIAAATYASEIAKLSRNQQVLLIVANPFGYAQNKWYGYTGVSVGDCDKYNLGTTDAPASPEAEAFTKYLLKHITKPCGVFNLHEDPPDDDGITYVDSHGTYIYVLGYGAEDHPVTLKIVQLLTEAGITLLMKGKSRHGHEIVKGKVIGRKDSSIDQFLAEKCHASPVIVFEIPTFIPIGQRVATHQKAMEIFLREKM